jgi:large subunit ribosomal protein L5
MNYIPNYKKKYLEEVIPVLKEKLGYKNTIQVPKLEKISINQGVNGAVADKKLVDKAVEELTLIAVKKLFQLMPENLSQTSNFVRECL